MAPGLPSPAFSKSAPALLAILLFPLLPGCLGPDRLHGAPAVDVPVPLVGDSYRYAGSDGSRLDVTVEGMADRLDGFLQRQASLVLAYRHAPSPQAPATGGPWAFEEAVGLATRSVVQQVALCGLWRGDPQQAGRIVCHDNRTNLLFGAQGLPGALGSSPWWGNKVSAGRHEVAAWDYLSGNATLSYEATAAGPDCMALRLVSAPVPLATLRPLPWTVLQRLDLCGDAALPASFDLDLMPNRPFVPEGTSQVRFTLLGHEGGKSPLQLPGRLAPTGAAPPDQLRSGNPPYADNDVPGLSFRAREAVEAARAQDAGFRRVLEAPGGFLSGAMHLNQSQGPGVSGVQGRSTQKYELEAMAADGSCWRVNVLRSEEVLLGSSQATDTAEGGRACAAGPPAALVDGQASLQQALRLGQGLAGLAARSGWFGYETDLAVHVHFWMDPRETGRLPRGYENVVRYDEPAASGPSTGLTIPYNLFQDGPTGLLVQVDVPRSRLPLQ